VQKLEGVCNAAKMAPLTDACFWNIELSSIALLKKVRIDCLLELIGVEKKETIPGTHFL
jgi:hypothetical protein